ncbi:DUF2322 family protein [Diaphorobacter sp. HDW4A]|uniref:DUF2322 family protein n=1 Tax=Diaphorobacter sp. HDW4A TaxID=2714924 RepID=UPI00140E768B|nr:DUF2322 family protein [Diaphorobacter sp. HDW4A]QIL80237.1 DUF2322 family protein [Diaphorobacter sp. HDW4A]
MAFADNLRQLPSVAHIAALRLLDASGNEVASIPNAPGKTGSLTIYAALTAKHGAINVAAAREGLELFAEHTEDARQHPGNHPNIDRLFDVIANSKSYSVQIDSQA